MTFAEDLQNMGVTWRAATRINNNNNNNNDKQICIAPQGRNFRSDSQRWRQCFFCDGTSRYSIPENLTTG